MIRFLPAFLISLLLLSGCASNMQSVSQQKGKNGSAVLILYKKTNFKEAVIKAVTDSLSQKGITVIKDSSKNARHYRSSDFAAVVYMAEYWAHHTPYHAKRYFERNKESRNTLFFVTSGDPDVKIKKPFDAVTSASKQDRVQPVSSEIAEKLSRIIKR